MSNPGYILGIEQQMNNMNMQMQAGQLLLQGQQQMQNTSMQMGLSMMQNGQLQVGLVGSTQATVNSLGQQNTQGVWGAHKKAQQGWIQALGAQ